MGLAATEIKIKKLASALGIIQGLAWTIMSILCIISYHTSEITMQPSNYIETVGHYIWQFFLFYDDPAFKNQTLIGETFQVFMWIYLLLDVAWIGLSVYLLRSNLPRALMAWSYFTLLISLWDFIFFVIIGADYNKCLDYVKDLAIGQDAVIVIQYEQVCANAILPVFVIAAKGFTLWLLNIFLSYILLTISKQLKRNP